MIHIKNNKILILIFSLVFFSNGIFFSNAYAYIDPGTGMAIIQVILGVLVGVGIALKIYWAKLKFKLSSSFSRNQKND